MSMQVGSEGVSRRPHDLVGTFKDAFNAGLLNFIRV
jgi:hypothetical protein